MARRTRFLGAIKRRLARRTAHRRAMRREAKARRRGR